jgi:hypothetical protein
MFFLVMFVSCLEIILIYFFGGLFPAMIFFPILE